MDLEYICKTIGNLSGIPIRIYHDKELCFYYSTVTLPKDPICVYEKQILDVSANIGYYVTPFFNYYGIVNSKNTKIVIGPTRQISNTDGQLKQMALEANVPVTFVEDFVQAMKSILPMPLESIMQMMCVIDHVLNDEKIEFKDIVIVDDTQKLLTEDIAKTTTTQKIDNTQSIDDAPHNTYYIEQTLQSIIAKGDTSALNKWVQDIQTVRGGKIAFDQIRQMKNTFIVTATICSRSAIKGGLDTEEALSLSDTYIQKCELFSSIADITNLQYHMIQDYTQRVEQLRMGLTPTKLYIDVSNYVSKHISEVITTQDIAKHLGVSRTNLSANFKRDTGKTLIDYIQQEKINEAKRLLRYTEKSIIDISYYLAYSSQSHFTRTFKKYTGLSPKEYRDSHTNKSFN